MVQPGNEVVDREATDADSMVVLSVSDVRCDDTDKAFITWDYNTNPVTVADANEQYGYIPDQPFAETVFATHVEPLLADHKRRDVGVLTDLVTQENTKTYKYPVNRLRVVATSYL
jgi:hypothetical protein